jgi:hypothetical protein
LNDSTGALSVGFPGLKVFASHFTFFQMPDSHILCYLIPSESGNTEAGQRRLNWVWYWNTSEKESKLDLPIYLGD